MRNVLAGGGDASGDSALLFIQPVFSATVTATGGTIVLTIPAADVVAGDVYYVAFFDPNALTDGWQLDWAGPGTVNGDQLTFALTSAPAFVARTSYVLSVYSVAATAPSPTPLPSSSATPTPMPSPTAAALSVTPASVSIPSPGTTQMLTVFEAGYNGTFSETNSCGGASAIATFSAASGSGPTWMPTVTGVDAGTCAATFSDANGQQTTITINVTSSGFTVNSTLRKEL